MESGFVYVMINPSIPDVVKVGKTTRSPENRASELSSATGVPTKFIVAYFEQFDDCHAAESYIHEMLEQGGYRVAQNREFFNAPLHAVVKIISDAPGKIATNAGVGERDASSIDEERNEGEIAPSQKPWVDLVNHADDLYYGRGDTIRDYRKALALYKKAAKLGYVEANLIIGNMFNLGEGVAEDKQSALKFWQIGASKKDWQCFGPMAEYYSDYSDLKVLSFDSSMKCIVQYLEGALRNESNFDTFSKCLGIASCWTLVSCRLIVRESIIKEIAFRLVDLKRDTLVAICEYCAQSQFGILGEYLSGEFAQGSYESVSAVLDEFAKFLDEFAEQLQSVNQIPLNLDK